jgi:hypothetical protein
MQRGPLLNPFAQQNGFCQGRLALIRPAVFSRSVFAGLSPHRLAPSHGTGLRWPQRFHLSRSTGEANPPAGRVFLSAFALQKPHSFPSGKPPLRARFPLGLRPHPFSPKLSRFRAGSFVAAETAPAPRFSQSLLWGVSLQSRARRKPEPGIPAKGFLWAQLFRSPEESSLPAAFACLPELPCLQPFVWNLTPFLLRRRLRNIPPLLRRRRSGSPAGRGRLGS